MLMYGCFPIDPLRKKPAGAGSGGPQLRVGRAAFHAAEQRGEDGGAVATLFWGTAGRNRHVQKMVVSIYSHGGSPIVGWFISWEKTKDG